ncbi:hypothetical protein E3N88_23762 [Mikania micrantha]|uniref:Acetolactate synthase small subunit C-terminal domain-containing protein n=1 Tax=Mikania micrantha TaxID=192012 RepID=A0A5N6NE67_9ASTR|nr:hypothetical protein E3N88_23762 [Mikania micrantha]
MSSSAFILIFPISTNIFEGYKDYRITKKMIRMHRKITSFRKPWITNSAVIIESYVLSVQLQRVGVISVCAGVEDLSRDPQVKRELMLVKLNVDQSTRVEMMWLVDIFRGNVVDASESLWTIEIALRWEKLGEIAPFWNFSAAFYHRDNLLQCTLLEMLPCLSLNILIKLMAIESLVLAPFFATHGGLLFKIF